MIRGEADKFHKELHQLLALHLIASSYSCWESGVVMLVWESGTCRKEKSLLWL